MGPAAEVLATAAEVSPSAAALMAATATATRARVATTATAATTTPAGMGCLCMIFRPQPSRLLNGNDRERLYDSWGELLVNVVAGRIAGKGAA